MKMIEYFQHDTENKIYINAIIPSDTIMVTDSYLGHVYDETFCGKYVFIKTLKKLHHRCLTNSTPTAFTFSNLTIKTLEKGVEYFQN